MTDSALTTRPATALVEGGIDWGVMEKVLMSGDLSNMTPQERLTYARQVCESIGVNILTKPFQYIEFYNGPNSPKVMQLYATRNLTDQLRRNHHIDVEVLDRRLDGDIYTVRVRATMDGRTEEEEGALFVGGLSGQRLADARMKTLTKAKRRVTLAICGLSFMDETEAETLPRARFLSDDEADRAASPTRAQIAPAPPTPVFADAHQVRLLGEFRAAGVIDIDDHQLADLTRDEAAMMIRDARIAARTPAPAAAGPVEPERASASDVRRLWTVADRTGYTRDEVRELIATCYPAARGDDDAPSSRALSPQGVQHLINLMESSPHVADESGGTRTAPAAVHSLWARAKELNWNTAELHKTALGVWPELADARGAFDGTKLTARQVARLMDVIEDRAVVRYGADGKPSIVDAGPPESDGSEQAAQN